MLSIGSGWNRFAGRMPPAVPSPGSSSNWIDTASLPADAARVHVNLPGLSPEELERLHYRGDVPILHGDGGGNRPPAVELPRCSSSSRAKLTDRSLPILERRISAYLPPWL